MLEAIGEKLIRLRWVVIAVWIAAAAVLAVVAHPIDPAANELLNFLPDDSPSIRGAAAMERHFPHSSGLSQAVIVIERRQPADAGDKNPPGTSRPGSAPATTTAPSGKSGLTPADLAAFADFARRLRRPLPKDLARGLFTEALSVRAPSDFPRLLKPNPLISPDGSAATAIVPVPANYVTVRSTLVVDHIRQAVKEQSWPPGLDVAVTGSAAFGRDYAAASKESHRRSLGVTVLAVLAILLIVYRAPLAAAAVLGTISMAAVVAHLLLTVATQFGLHVGTVEMIFVMVLLYGAGVDYSLLYFSRFRECLAQTTAPTQAAARSWSLTARTILASAATVIGGLLMLSAAQFKIFQTTGRAVALALTVALAAALTLMPAIAAIAHRRLFWPLHRTGAIGAGRFWTAVADTVTGRPALVFLLCLAVLAVPAVNAVNRRYVYDTVTGLGPRYQAVHGLDMVKRHWPIGQVMPLTVLLEGDPERLGSPPPFIAAGSPTSRLGTPADSPGAQPQLAEASRQLTDELSKVKGVADLRSLSQPLGLAGRGMPAPLQRLFAKSIRSEYVGADGLSIRLVVVLGCPAFSNEAMAVLEHIRASAARLVPEGANLYFSGATAEMVDLRSVTKQDFYRIVMLTLSVVFVIVLLLMRDVILSAFMVASTVLSYLATLGVTWWFFTGVVGQAGLDWKVEVFLFVVMVAVGQDYNIFLAARLAEESSRLGPRAAARAAIIQTGGIISSAGMIMAATLGSLALGDLMLLVQLGFAFALGMLVDTFLVRPLLLPAFAAVTGRTGQRASWRR